MHSPTHLFMIPGAVMALIGALISLTVLLQIDVLGRTWDLHTMIAGSLLIIVGSQVVALGLTAHAYATYFMGAKDPWFDRMRSRLRLEHGLLLGGTITLAGILVSAVVVGIWIDHDFGELSDERAAIAAATLIIVGSRSSSRRSC